jgi:hypothetical protein
MHRAGTSAMTGALAALGMALPPEGDLIQGRPDNPVHYESDALVALNDRILASVGGWWDAPPVDGLGPQVGRVEAMWNAEAVATLERIFPGPGPNVWKDPRNCLLLPYWRGLLADPVVVVLVWRSPLSVALSLRERDGSTIAQGLALWEYYNRRALDAVVGLPAYVVNDEELIRAPLPTLTAIAEWLTEVGIEAHGHRGWDVGSAARRVTPGLSHHGSSDLAGILPSQIEVIDHLEALRGPHAIIPPVTLGPPSLWTADTLATAHAQRLAGDRYLRLAEGNKELSDAHDELIATYRDQVAISDERLEHIHKLQQMADERAEEAARMAADVQRLGTGLSQLEAETGVLTADRDAWRTRAEDRESDLDRMRSSSSWRLTAPLRSARDALRRAEHPGPTAT